MTKVVKFFKIALYKCEGEIINYFMGEVYKRSQSEILENQLSEFLKKNGFRLDNETDIISICEKLNLSAFYASLDELNVDGFILVNENHRVIGIDEKLSALDARFLIAHELGHYITEVKDKQPSEVLIAAKDKLYHGKEKSSHEHDMDYLAAAILVPKNQFIWELKALDINFGTLHSEEEVRKNIQPDLIAFFAKRYRVKEQLIVRRIAEVSYYA